MFTLDNMGYTSWGMEDHIYFGVIGNALAWGKGSYASIEEFIRSQKLWGISVSILYASLGTFFVYMLNFSLPIDIALKIANENTAAINYFGTPITKEFSLSGNSSYHSHARGARVNVDIKVKGSKNSGYLIIDAEKVGSVWILSKVVIENLNREPQ